MIRDTFVKVFKLSVLNELQQPETKISANKRCKALYERYIIDVDTQFLYRRKGIKDKFHNFLQECLRALF